MGTTCVFTYTILINQSVANYKHASMGIALLEQLAYLMQEVEWGGVGWGEWLRNVKTICRCFKKPWIFLSCWLSPATHTYIHALNFIKITHINP